MQETPGHQMTELVRTPATNVPTQTLVTQSVATPSPRSIQTNDITLTLTTTAPLLSTTKIVVTEDRP